MLVELAVTNLGVIDHARLTLGAGLTALTGETGAGKTMLVEAIELLVGARADAALVRPGCEEATVEGRFVVEDREVVLSRVIPAVGRSRGYIDGRLAPASALAEWAEQLVDLHGQHAHQSLLGVATQRAALDRFGGVELGPLVAAREQLTQIERALAAMGGDERARAREIDLLRFQISEIERARIEDADEDERLEAEEELLSDAIAHRDAAAAAAAALSDDAGALDSVGAAMSALAGRTPFEGLHQRLRAVSADVSDIASDLRNTGEAIAEDPERLSAVLARRQLLRDLRRKYGESLRDVIGFAAEASERLRELEAHEQRAAVLESERRTAEARLAGAAAAVAGARRAAAPRLAAAVQAQLAQLGMAKAELRVSVGDRDPGDEVSFLLAANPGSPSLPLAKVASGGELARAMLALRVVLIGDDGPSTLVFDEVDAGIGGSAATAVGRALAQLSRRCQVMVITHLAQVAAFADAQIAVAKHDDGATTTASVAVLGESDRLIELSRMLSGSPASSAAQEHAAELLEAARRR